MTNIDKIIKFDFKCVKERYFFCLFVIAASVLWIELMNGYYIVPLSTFVFVYQGIKIDSYLYGESLFADGEILYKSFPLEADELIVAKIILGWTARILNIMGIALLWFIYWGVPEVETNCIDFMYSAMGMFYRFGVIKCVAMPLVVMIYIFEIEIISMSNSAAQSRSDDEYFNKAAILWTLVYMKSLVILILAMYMIVTHLQIISMIVIADMLLNLVICYFALRYIKAVLEGRK